MIKINTVITGSNRVVFMLRAMEPETRSRLRAAVQATTVEVEELARQYVPISGPHSRKSKQRPGPGELRSTIRSSFALDGLTGYVMAGFGKLPRRSRAKNPAKLGPLRLSAFKRQQRRLALKQQRELGVYAMVINYGSPARGIQASRYLDRAKDARRLAHIDRVKTALVAAAAASSQGLAA